MELLREFCAENLTLVPAAISAGARRIELCDNLAVGGTTPSYGVVRSALELARERGVDVMVMARPRGGDFSYDARERDIMLDDIACARRLGATGVVLGCTRLDDERGTVLDEELTKVLVEVAKGTGTGIAAGTTPVQVTFHMAFDALDANEQFPAIDALAGMGVERILTHGGVAATPIEDNIARLRELIAHADGRLTILPGGGITWQNAEQIATALGVHEVHGTRIVRL